MPSQVQYRLGSIFDEDCDILIIPVSRQGAVSPWLGEEMATNGIPLLPVAPAGPGAIKVEPSTNPRFRYIGYALLVRWTGKEREFLGVFANSLAGLAGTLRATRIAMPLTNTIVAGISAREALASLERGFSFAPAGAKLVLSIRSRSMLRNVASEGSRDPVTARTQRSRPAGRSHIFISYSHADAEWLKRLQKHLRPLEREGMVVWDDTRLKPGEPWREEIREALAATKVAILLISADFLASDFIITNELPPLLQAAEEHGATILPVIISPSRFTRTESLSRFQAVNDPEKPLVQMRRGNQEKVLDDVARAVEDAVNR